MKKVRKYGIIGFLVFLLGVVFYQVKKLTEIVIDFSRIKVNEIGKTIDLIIYFNVENKSDLSAKIIYQYYDVYLNGILLHNIKEDKDIIINKNAITEMPVKVIIPRGELLKVGLSVLTSFLSGQRGLLLEVKGSIRVTTKKATKGVKVPFEYKYKIK